MDDRQLRKVFDWLVDGAPGAPTAPDVVGQLGQRIVELGIPLSRMAAFVRTLHPHLMGRSFIWKPGAPVQVNEASHAVLNSPQFLASPINRVFQTREPFRRCLCRGDQADYEILEKLAKEGTTDYLVAPLTFMNGEVHGMVYSSTAEGGFTDEHVAALLDLTRPLSRVAEILALSRVAVTLLDTYVGRNAGERILKGHILRGDTDDIRCVIWFSDLRGFTRMSDTVPPGTLIRTLNELFDCQVPPIQTHGGDVLKFMGDGMLAIFPIEGDVEPVCQRALRAAHESFEALEKLNSARRERGEPELRFGLALHVGNVAYGNIGGQNRLDFTCIGPAVNLAARIESLAGRLDRSLLMSAEFASNVPGGVASVGEHELKGVAQRQKVYELATS